jgi:uncharacterized protein (TIGR03437 family)
MCGACLAVADFNGDGIPDIGYAYNELTPGSGVVLGNGDGTFRPGVIFPIFHNDEGVPNGFFAADFNGDGRADVLYSSAESIAWIALGNGDGTFQAPIGVSACTSVAAVADVNRDGNADLICGTSILLGKGDGTFRAGATVDANQMDVVLLAADFNGDGNSDLLLQRLSGQLAVALGRGDGTFAADLPVATILTSPITGDFNGDGRVDLAGVCTKAGLICVLPGGGDGTFGNAVMTPLAPGSLAAAADFNGDGKLDLVAGNAVLTGNGDGTFRVPTFFGPGTQACTPPPLIVPCSSVTLEAAVADFNRDGLPDLVAGSVTSVLEGRSIFDVGVLLNDSPGDGFLTAGVSSATLTWPVGPGSIASAFGVNLSPATQAAPPGPPPTTLGGIRLHVRDLLQGDQLAPLLYVSPSQINYVMPSSSAPYAWIGVERVGAPFVPKGIAANIATLAPGFYSVGAGLAAASALRVGPGGTETAVPVIACASPVCSAAPIDLSGAPVYLSLYGTGFAQAMPAGSTCTIAGQTLPVSYAGPQIQIMGLDQVNVLLPNTLAGAGATSVSCLFQAGDVTGASNAVDLTIR